MQKAGMAVCIFRPSVYALSTQVFAPTPPSRVCGVGGAFIIIILVFVKRGVLRYFFVSQSEGTIKLRTFA
jgi:hypothetical protein